MRVILHIGNFKTGTTALQNWFYQNRISLRREHIFYGVATEYVNSHIGTALGLLYQVLKEQGKLSACPVLSQMVEGDGSMLFDSDADLAKMKRMAEMTMCDTLLLSCEGLFADLLVYAEGLRCILSEEELFEVREGIRQKIYACFPGAEVVCYLRRQDDYLDAMYREYCKVPWRQASSVCPFSDFWSNSRLCISYWREVAAWRKLFGDCCRFWGYQRQMLYGEDIVTDFCHAVFGWNTEKTRQFQPVADFQSNSSFSADAIAYRVRHPELDEMGLHLLKLYSDANPDTVRYSFLSKEQREKVMAFCEEDNRRLSEIGCLLHGEGTEPLEYAGISERKERDISEYIESYYSQPF